MADEASNEIIGIEKEVFYDGLKNGAIAGVVSGVVDAIASILALFVLGAGTIFAFMGFFGAAGMTTAVIINKLISSSIYGAVWGIVWAVIIIKFGDKMWGKTLFQKALFIPLAIDILFAVLFSWTTLFMGPLSFIVIFGGAILSDVVYAYIFSKGMSKHL